MTRAVIYARFSSDLQNPRSIEDQFRLARELAARRGFGVVAEFSDAAASGRTIHRPGLQTLLSAARKKAFDVLICEALDRLSRGLADVARIFEELEFLDVRIVTVEEGDVAPMHVAFKGAMNAQFITALASKVRRGQRGNIEAGRAAGGLSYGYRPAHRLDDRGRVIRGERVIDEFQARVIRRVFGEYAAGLTPIAIAKRLNADGIPSPRGGQWNASSILGHPRRLNGILRNSLYAGKIVYNRSRKVKDPSTGRRLNRDNDPQARIERDAPHLRIVEEKLWLRVRAVDAMHSSPEGNTRRSYGPRHTHLLSGLVKCAECGRSYISHAADALRCSSVTNGKVCNNRRIVRRASLETLVLNSLREELTRKEAVDFFVETYTRYIKEFADSLNVSRRDAESRLTAVHGKISNLVAAIEDGEIPNQSLKRRMAELEAEEQSLKATLERQPEAIANLPYRNPHEVYAEVLDDLRQSLTADPVAQAEAASALRNLIDRIEVVPSPEPGNYGLNLYGRIDGILAWGNGQTPTEQGQNPQLGNSGAQGRCASMQSDQ
jgi:site-specific DNA recombinase